MPSMLSFVTSGATLIEAKPEPELVLDDRERFPGSSPIEFELAVSALVRRGVLIPSLGDPPADAPNGARARSPDPPSACSPGCLLSDCAVELDGGYAATA